jgi:DNA-binding PucR family transcriptional regulator
VWAWLGSQRKPSPTDLERALSGSTPASLALGEPRQGLDGWRQTHQEAQAALLVARRRPHEEVTRCADVPLEAALLLNGALATLLVETYLAPLNSMRGGGQTARETLRAYFQYGRNVSSTAFALGVARRTVENRLRQIELRLGRPLQTCLTALEVALRLEGLGGACADDA